jgi:hypothetical protein
MIVQAMPYPAVAAGGTAPTPPTATYAYDYTGRSWASQSTGPSALYVAAADKTYVAWEAQAQFRHIKIASYDHATGSWSTPVVIDSHVLEDDDHGVPALELLSDGRLVCFYGSHSTNQPWAISGQSGGIPTITSWTRQTALSDTGNGYSYPKPVNIDAGSGAGTLYLFMRKTIAVSSPTNLRYVLRKATYTSGGALSFGSEIALINFDGGSGARVYAMEARLNSGNVEFMATRADLTDTTRQHVYYFRYIPSTGALENLSGSASQTTEIDLTTANASYREKTSSGSNVTGIVSWCRDSNGYLHILYGDDTDTPFNVTHDWHNGTSWQGETTAFSTTRLSTAGSSGYTNEWCLVPRGSVVDVYYPVNNNGGFTSYGGDDIARKTWSGSWGSEVLVLEGDETTALGFPTAVKDADAGLRVIFTECSQDAIFESWAAHKRYFLGDSGYLEWPAPSDAKAFENVLVLNFQGANNATATSDESGFANLHPVTFNGNAKLDTATAPPWGSSWLKLDGSGDYLSIPQSRGSLPDGGDWSWGGGGHTMEIVLRPNETGRGQYLISTRIQGTTNKGASLIITSANKFQFFAYDASGTQVVNMTGSTTISAGTVYKVGVKRKTDGTWALYVNGTSEATNVSAAPDPGSANLLVGKGFTAGTNDTTNNFNGWIKQIRLTRLADRDLTVVPSADFPVS